MEKGKTLAAAAAKTDMDEKTARKYVKAGTLPSQIKTDHHWRTRTDPFEQVWPQLRSHLEINPGLEAKTLFEDLQRRHPGQFSDGQLRTLQRKIKRWRALEGPPKEVFFPQQHHPGRLCQSDFTDMRSLGITIDRQRFDHLLYHFVLTWSNWETGMICYSESFESLSEGLQKALWQLGGVPQAHQTDCLSAAVHQDLNANRFTERYQALMRHYGLSPHKTHPSSPHQNGDVEQRHHRFKRALDQSLMLRGSRDFESLSHYQRFLDRLFEQLNSGRAERFCQEVSQLRALPDRQLDACRPLQVKVGPSSTIRVLHNVYSVDSRLIGERVQVRLYGERLEIWYGQRCVDVLPRLRSAKRHCIQYRHIIDWLIRKPGAFENYRYRQDLFPSHYFRIAYDQLKQRLNGRSNQQYLQILHLAATRGEDKVEGVLRRLYQHNQPILAEDVRRLLEDPDHPDLRREVAVDPVQLDQYDRLLQHGRMGR